MSRWDGPLPPNRMARWVARHLWALQIGWAVFAVAYATFIVVFWTSNGWREGISLLPSLTGFALGGLAFRHIAGSVARYDDRHGR